ncbi:membrane protein of unknown function [Candidatus Promineifilum breve]|uniref:Uncharacterized protein n=1 Tax=Candidatus Promineifilum breve TaxID=1806508 RepID=A0A161KAH4_9CHLR|nr:hypothetical protein [Candidatus Promineifilum breve]CUS03233.2 membrane protein of unknown function [Candidatus Promineifilum breve]
MNTYRQKELAKEVKRLLKNRNQYVGVSKKRKVLLYLLFFASLLIAAFYFAFGLQLYKSPDVNEPVDSVYYLLFAVSALCVALTFLLFAQSPPQAKPKINNWFLWRGRLLLMLGIGIYVVQAVNQLLPSSHNILGGNRYVYVIGYVTFSVFLCTVIAILSKPELFLADRLTNIASACFAFAISTSPIRINLALLPSSYDSSWYAYLFALLLLLFIFIEMRLNPKRLNHVQRAVIWIINPARLLLVLRSRDEVIRDQYQALEVKLKLDNDLPLGVQKELIRILVEENKNAKDILWWIVPILVLVVTVVFESLVNDLIYQDIVKPFLCQFLPSICN